MSFQDIAVIDAGASPRFASSRHAAISAVECIAERRLGPTPVNSGIALTRSQLARYLFYPTRLMHVMAHGERKGQLSSDLLHPRLNFWPFERWFDLDDWGAYSDSTGLLLDIDCLILDACTSNTPEWRAGLARLMPPGKQMLLIGTTATVSWPEAVTYTTCFYSHLLHESRFRTEKAFHSRQVDRFIGESQDAHTQARRAYQSLHGVPSLFRADVVTGKGR